MGVVFALLSAMSWGVSNALVRRAQTETSYDTQIGTVLTIIMNNIINIILFTGMIIKTGANFECNFAGIGLFALGGFLNSCIGRSLLYNCFSHVGAARGGVIKGIMPLFVILGSIVFLQEKLTSKMWIGIAIILCGVYSISFDTLARTKADGKKANAKIGILIGLLSCGFLASGNLLRKVGLSYINNSVLGVTVGSIVGLLGYMIFLLSKGQMKDLLNAIKEMNKDYIVGGALSSASLYFLFFAMQTIPIAMANSVAASEPLFTILMSWLILKNNEKITWKTILGGVLVAIGAIVLILA